MRLVRGGRVVEDSFRRVLDDAPVPDAEPVLLPAERLLADARDLAWRAAPTGVIWPNDRRIAELVTCLDWLALVALVFPTFRDGRAYSQARILREQYGFRGELRATGQVLRDQLLFLHRAGFDVFEVSKDEDAAHFAQVLERYSVFYQPTGDGRISAPEARLRMRNPEPPARASPGWPVTSKFRTDCATVTACPVALRQTRFRSRRLWSSRSGWPGGWTIRAC